MLALCRIWNQSLRRTLDEIQYNEVLNECFVLGFALVFLGQKLVQILSSIFNLCYTAGFCVLQSLNQFKQPDYELIGFFFFRICISGKECYNHLYICAVISLIRSCLHFLCISSSQCKFFCMTAVSCESCLLCVLNLPVQSF